MIRTIFRIVILILYKIFEFFVLLVSIPNYFKKPRKCPPIDNNLLLYSATSLAEMIRKKEISSESVIRAYISRIKEVNPVLNAVVDERFDQALNEAKCVDQMISNTRLSVEELEERYPLLGIPLTVKESLAIEGLSHCSGSIFPGGQRVAAKDSDVVRLCKEAGAIILLASNTPDMSSYFETFNKITGKTCNPYDTRRTPGGSSGGEGALLAAGASVMGIGTDIAGSVRLPAHFCGIWGHKPTGNTVSILGHYPNSKNVDTFSMVFSPGPMCRYAVDLPLLFKVILKEKFNAALNLNDRIHIENIKFYYIQNNNRSILCHGIETDILAATKNLLDYLTSKYHCTTQELRVSELKMSPELSAATIYSIGKIENLFEDDGKGSFGELFRFLTCRSHSTLPPILYGVLNRIMCLLPRSVILNCNEQILQLKKKLCEILGEDGVLIYPTHFTAAPFHGKMYGRLFDCAEMAIFNCLGFPATHCPLGLNSQGLPIGVQIVAAPNNDRLTLAVAKEIEKTFGGWIAPPFAKPAAP